jgi:hypothetical protein
MSALLAVKGNELTPMKARFFLDITSEQNVEEGMNQDRKLMKKIEVMVNFVIPRRLQNAASKNTENLSDADVISAYTVIL